MYSSEREFIPTSDAVDPKDKKVEDWMGEVENMMFTTIRDVLEKSILDYTTRPRTDWIKNHPGQCVLNGSQVHWTKECEDAIKKSGYEGVKKFLDSQESQLLDTVDLVRQRLSKLQTMTLGALIVIDVHARDVIFKLVENRVEDITHFLWISQLRYYWTLFKGQEECFV